MLFLMLLNCLIPIFVSQENFRTILIERACQRRPSLNFCADFSTRQPSTSESKSEELLLPEEIKSIPQALITTSSNEMTSNTTPRISDVPSTSLSNVSTNSPIDEVNFDNLTQTEELLGSLLRLPKPEEDVATTGLTSMSTVGQPVFPENTSITPTSIEDEKTVLVFVSEYCVVHRERFVKKCHGDVSQEEEIFCKTYPSSCASTVGVIPVVSYCQRYYKHYPMYCSGSKIERELLQFCFAFEQFCLPELTPAVTDEKPQSSLRRCEDVLPEAQRICNPFPHPRDTFNVLRCSNFLSHCKKFVDWS